MTEPSLPDSSPAPSRRSMLGLLTMGLGSLPVLGGLFVALRSGLAPAKGERPAQIPLCRLEEVPETGIKQVTDSFRQRQGALVETVNKVVFVTRDPETKEILALRGECTHLSCPVQQKPLALDAGGKAPLTCPCHGGMFSATGAVLQGPPRAPLKRLRLAPLPKSADGMLLLEEV